MENNCVKISNNHAGNGRANNAKRKGLAGHGKCAKNSARQNSSENFKNSGATGTHTRSEVLWPWCKYLHVYMHIYTVWSARQKAATSKKPQQTNNNQKSHMARKKVRGSRMPS